jgi:hypothetical protein
VPISSEDHPSSIFVHDLAEIKIGLKKDKKLSHILAQNPFTIFLLKESRLLGQSEHEKMISNFSVIAVVRVDSVDWNSFTRVPDFPHIEGTEGRILAGRLYRP